MDGLELLQTRVSVPVLGEPAPDDAQLDAMLRAALRAPDHRVLRPWRFLKIAGEGLDALGALFLEAGLEADPGLDEEARRKLHGKPRRAPLIVVVIATLKADDTVPEHEQMISAGCCVNNMMLAAHAQGVGAMWRTGGMATNPTVLRGLGLAENERLVGFLYLGTPCGAVKRVPQLEPEDFVAVWPPAEE